MTSVVFYFQVHQPYRLRVIDAFEIGNGSDKSYFESEKDTLNKDVFLKVADKCYLPASKMLFELTNRFPQFCFSLSFSGMVLEQMQTLSWETLTSFQRLINTNQVEVLSETYYHSLASLYSKAEFLSQIEKHRELIEKLFSKQTTAFRNTELIYNDDISDWLYEAGFDLVLTEGVERYLGWRSPNYPYTNHNGKVNLLLRNYHLSDDLSYHFDNKLAAGKTVGQFVDQLLSQKCQVINLFIDLETFGEHLWADSGIFDYFTNLIAELAAKPELSFSTVSQAGKTKPVGIYNAPETISWADSEKNISAWLDNSMQQNAASAVYEIEENVLKTQDQQLIDTWRRLTQSDHFYYMSTKYDQDGQVHQYFSPYESAFQAYNNFINILHDMRQKVYTKNKEGGTARE